MIRILFAALWLIGMAFMWAPPAHAQTLNQAICNVLDTDPSTGAITDIGIVLHNNGYTYREAGQQVAIAVYTTCPQYLPVLNRFIDMYSSHREVV